MESKTVNVTNLKTDLTDEDKLLLIRDLSYRLPYNSLCASFNEEFTGCSVGQLVCMVNEFKQYGYTDIELRIDENNVVNTIIDFCRPVLKRPESMSLPDVQEFIKVMDDAKQADGLNTKLIDWFCEHHIDFYGLIDKGLAIDYHLINN